RILSELLDLSQVESGRIQLSIQTVEPAVMADKAVESVLNVAREKNIGIRKDIAAGLPAIHADADKTTWVLNNFLTNAIRHSDKGSMVTISVQPKDGKTEFAVQDSGKGIDPRYKDRIFDRYFKVPGNKEGTGLGLAICKEFIEAQGSSITVESEPGKGSRFSFSL
ncbi:MAG: HAMP domain-containing sensor histidine kinase, partial [Chitinophagaceae bacterium]